jgi:hypothetical protein
MEPPRGRGVPPEPLSRLRNASVRTYLTAARRLFVGMANTTRAGLKGQERALTALDAKQSRRGAECPGATACGRGLHLQGTVRVLKLTNWLAGQGDKL